MQEQGTTTVRRTRVPGRPGIYCRFDSRGRERFEFCYRDSDGRQRWRTVEGGVNAAIAAREDVRARMRRGERIAPSKITFAELSTQWLEQVVGLRPRSIDWYRRSLRKHLNPKIGRIKVCDLRVDDIACLIGSLQRDGLAPTTVRSVLVPVKRVLDHAVRRGLIQANPIGALERHERPKVEREEMRILDRDDIDKLLKTAPEKYRVLLATAIFTGLRQASCTGCAGRTSTSSTGWSVCVGRSIVTGSSPRPRPRTPIARCCSYPHSLACCANTESPPATHGRTTTSSATRAAGRYAPRPSADTASSRRSRTPASTTAARTCASTTSVTHTPASSWRKA